MLSVLMYLALYVALANVIVIAGIVNNVYQNKKSTVKK